MEVTLFKIDLDGAQLTANAPFSGSGWGSDADTDTGADADVDADTDAARDSTEGGRGKGKLAGATIVGLLFLTAVAAVARKLRGREAGPSDPDVDLTEEVAATAEPVEDSDGSKRGKGKLAGASFIGLLFLFVVAVVTRKARGGGAEEV